MNTVRTAFICFGEINTSIERLKMKHDEALNYLETLGVSVFDCGIVIDDPHYASAEKAIEILNKHQDIASIVLCIGGWVPSHAVIRVIEGYKHIPMLLWGLCGWKEGNRIVTTAEQAGTSALRSTLEEMGYAYTYLYNSIGKPFPERKIKAFLSACCAVRSLRSTRTLSVGYRDMLLYNTQYEAMSVRSTFGIEVESMEMLELVQNLDHVDPKEVEQLVRYMRDTWLLLKPCDVSLLETGARYALAVGKKIQEENYQAITINDVDGMKKLLNFPPAIVFMLITKLYGIDTTPENDVMGNLMQLIMKHLSGKNAHYMEYYEYFDKSLLIGVPDYVPEYAVDGKTQILPAAFGLLQGSLLNVSKVKTGYVTCTRLAYKKGKFVMHVYSGEAKTPPAWEEFGWDQPAPQLSSLEVFPDSCTVDEFAQRVCSQHVIISYGDYKEELRYFCSLLGIEMV
ncbi:MAG: hypothetical protein PHU24_07115 [Sphaerochaetaceae bacterium]|jgi:L-fucose isomerase-like protein|nr:hypothetical protein [Sphaerochaetaceae bacterium]NLO60314.1 hypothetical protein [Spirochaetales bacterium]MDD2406204.1 hypothetical protein [Sphaerochaetaceae bacterium]MDD3670164.1 hypothetical protein [Sphaerochaetaceae bacterium]MDD4258678.1 hypothetical protein [Sphaerochaetaceae bacterium]